MMGLIMFINPTASKSRLSAAARLDGWTALVCSSPRLTVEIILKTDDEAALVKGVKSAATAVDYLNPPRWWTIALALVLWRRHK